MLGCRIEMSLEVRTERFHSGEEVFIHILNRETGELRKIRMDFQKFFHKVLGSRRWVRENNQLTADERFVIDNIILHSKGE